MSNSTPINLVVLYGGKSGEHEISLISAAHVLARLDTHRYHIIPLGIDKEGNCYLNDYQELRTYTESLPVVTAKSQPLPGLWIEGRFVIEKADLVFPVVHGPLYEDGCLQGLLELAGIGYVGCDVLPSAIAMDKDIARRLGCMNDIQSARYRTLSWQDGTVERQQICEEMIAELGWPLFVKPCSLGSSVGIHKAKNREELFQAVDDAFRYDKMVIVEEFLSGREIELAVLENPLSSREPFVSVAGEIKVHHPHGFYSYTAKYLEPAQTELCVPAELSDEVMNKLKKAAGDIFSRLKCRGMARVDFFVCGDSQTLYFNELNTIPGFTSISMYPKLWEASGLDYSLLLDKLIELALIHQRHRQQLVTNYQ